MRVVKYKQDPRVNMGSISKGQKVFLWAIVGFSLIFLVGLYFGSTLAFD